MKPQDTETLHALPRSGRGIFITLPPPKKTQVRKIPNAVAHLNRQKNKNRGAQKYANIIASKIFFLRHNG